MFWRKPVSPALLSQKTDPNSCNHSFFVLNIPLENAVAHLPDQAFLAICRINFPTTWNPHVTL